MSVRSTDRGQSQTGRRMSQTKFKMHLIMCLVFFLRKSAYSQRASAVNAPH
jgi:hypothetical protein